MKDFAKSIVCNSVTEKEFNTEADLRRWCIEHQYAYTPTHGGYYRLEDDKPGRNRPDLYAHVKAGNSKVGNGINVPPVTPSQKPGSKPNPDNNQNPKKNQKEEITDKNGRTFREVLEEVKKTGNKYNIKPMSYKADAYRYGKELAEQDFKNFKYSNTSTLESIYRNNTSGEDYEQYGFSDFKKGYYDTYQQMDKKVGNSTEKLFYGLSKDAEKEEEKSDEDLDELKKTGNETYQHKLYPDKYVIIEGKNYKIVTDGKVEKSGELTDAVLYGINQTYKRVGNSSSNEEYWKKQYIEAARKKGISEREIQEFVKKIEKEGAKGVLIPVKNVSSEYEILKQDPSKMHPMYKKAYEEAMKKLAREDEEFKKRFEKEYGVKAKNEASDDKFAYVMREFDEGKLKTPDGKVVTDPAQAKAIAYSESKKTENGIARARNAIKKNS